MNQDFYWLEDNSAEYEQEENENIKELQYLALKCRVEY